MSLILRKSAIAHIRVGLVFLFFFLKFKSFLGHFLFFNQNYVSFHVQDMACYNKYF